MPPIESTSSTRSNRDQRKPSTPIPSSIESDKTFDLLLKNELKKSSISSSISSELGKTLQESASQSSARNNRDLKKSSVPIVTSAESDKNSSNSVKTNPKKTSVTIPPSSEKNLQQISGHSSPLKSNRGQKKLLETIPSLSESEKTSYKTACDARGQRYLPPSSGQSPVKSVNIVDTIAACVDKYTGVKAKKDLSQPLTVVTCDPKVQEPDKFDQVKSLPSPRKRHLLKMQNQIDPAPPTLEKNDDCTNQNSHNSKNTAVSQDDSKEKAEESETNRPSSPPKLSRFDEKPVQADPPLLSPISEDEQNRPNVYRPKVSDISEDDFSDLDKAMSPKVIMPVKPKVCTPRLLKSDKKSSVSPLTKTPDLENLQPSSSQKLPSSSVQKLPSSSDQKLPSSGQKPQSGSSHRLQSSYYQKLPSSPSQKLSSSPVHRLPSCGQKLTSSPVQKLPSNPLQLLKMKKKSKLAPQKGQERPQKLRKTNKSTYP